MPSTLSIVADNPHSAPFWPTLDVMTDTMKAITLSNPEDKTSLTLTEVPMPQLASGEALVKVHATGVNRGDLLQAAGHYPPPPGASEIIGLECAGTVVDPGTTGHKRGDQVACLLAGGGYAEYVAVPEGQLMPLPEGYSFVEAASIVEVACTVWSNLVMLAGLHEGQTLLIHGGAGGIGTFAIQLGKNVRALAMDGHMVIIGMQGGVKGELNIARLLTKRGTISATALRARKLDDKARIVSETVENVWPMLADGRITHRIHATIPLADAARAHELLGSGAVTGKVILEVD